MDDYETVALVGFKNSIMENNHNQKEKKENTPTKTEHPFKRSGKMLRSPVLSSSLSPSMVAPSNIVAENPQPKENNTSDTAIIEKMNMFEKMCEDMKKQIHELTLENLSLKEALSIYVNKEQMEFHTDEEELARETQTETDWILQKSKKKNSKKRKAEESPEVSPEAVKVVRTMTVNEAKKPKLPPVILSNINDFNKVKDLMSAQNIKYEIKLLSNNQLSLKVTSDNDYRVLTRAINEAKFEWHSYENKATRPCKVIARGLHPTCNPEYISEDLKLAGFNVISVVNLTKKKKVNDKQIVEPLPLFMLTFDNSEDTKKVFSIKHIVNTKVKIEALRKSRDQVPQCKRCQRFEHTQAFCKREPRCVSCSGNHLTIECKVDRKAPPKCANCHEAHPANYRGCLVAKELKKRRQMKKKANVTKPKPQKIPTPKVVQGQLFSEVVKKTNSERKSLGKSSAQPAKNPHNSSKEDLFMSTLERMINRMDEISARLEKIENRYARPMRTPRSINKR